SQHCAAARPAEPRSPSAVPPLPLPSSRIPYINAEAEREVVSNIVPLAGSINVLTHTTTSSTGKPGGYFPGVIWEMLVIAAFRVTVVTVVTVGMVVVHALKPLVDFGATSSIVKRVIVRELSLTITHFVTWTHMRALFECSSYTLSTESRQAKTWKPVAYRAKNTHCVLQWIRNCAAHAACRKRYRKSTNPALVF
ncbi:MAG: hypothetical protein FWD68_20380, partial [Alphaproteobacteria bacterium]|nr:hypothetical protein [Alphaproteobacteria bacterium]